MFNNREKMHAQLRENILARQNKYVSGSSKQISPRSKYREQVTAGTQLEWPMMETDNPHDVAVDQSLYNGRYVKMQMALIITSFTPNLSQLIHRNLRTRQQYSSQSGLRSINIMVQDDNQNSEKYSDLCGEKQKGGRCVKLRVQLESSCVETQYTHQNHFNPHSNQPISLSCTIDWNSLNRQLCSALSTKDTKTTGDQREVTVLHVISLDFPQSSIGQVKAYNEQFLMTLAKFYPWISLIVVFASEYSAQKIDASRIWTNWRTTLQNVTTKSRLLHADILHQNDTENLVFLLQRVYTQLWYLEHQPNLQLQSTPIQ